MIRKGSGKRNKGDSSSETAARLADYTGERSAPVVGHGSLGTGSGLPGSPEGATASMSASPASGTQYHVTDLTSGMEALGPPSGKVSTGGVIRLTFITST